MLFGIDGKINKEQSLNQKCVIETICRINRNNNKKRKKILNHKKVQSIPPPKSSRNRWDPLLTKKKKIKLY